MLSKKSSLTTSGGNLNCGTDINGDGEGWPGLGGGRPAGEEVNGAGLDGVDEVVDEGFELESPVDDATLTLTTEGVSVRAKRQDRYKWRN